MTAEVITTAEKIKEAKNAPDQATSTTLLDSAKDDVPKSAETQKSYFSQLNYQLHQQGVIPGLEITGIDEKGNFKVLNEKTGKVDIETDSQFTAALKGAGAPPKNRLCLKST